MPRYTGGTGVTLLSAADRRRRVSPFASGSAGYDNLVSSHSPNGWWKMGEASGNAADSSGNGLTGTASGTNGPTYGHAGPFGGIKAMGFDGIGQTSSYLDMGQKTLLDGISNAPFTLIAWVWIGGLGQAYSSVVSFEGTAAGYTLMIKSTGLLACYINGTNYTSDYDGTGSNTLSTSTWYMLAMTWPGSGGAVKGYVNGSLDGTGNTASGTNAEPTAHFYVATSHFASRALNGLVCEVAYVPSLLTAAQLLALYNAAI